ncbi:MAG: competence/damage-inducible protein A [Flavobacteriaceae bacterium]|nr:competence/damage-inducible protein A [Flavobacteriaceae bacterium]
MQAEIITIGDEILIGQILDSNSKWIAEELNKIGVSVYQITSIQDDKQHILKALAEAKGNADIIILTGGLGPTKDDITKHTLVDYFDDKLTMQPEIAEHIKHLFAKINYQYTDLDIQQAMLPEKANILKNYLGTASGMWFDKGGKVFVSLPGVPNEMKGLMTNCVLPNLQKSFQLPFILHKTVQTIGMGESKVAKRIEQWENDLPKSIKLAYLPSYGKLRLRLTAKGSDKKELEEAVEVAIDKLYHIIGDIIVGMEISESLEASIQNLLVGSDQTLSTAESCTGGSIAKMITSVAGASKYFCGSAVVYSAKAKKEILKIASKTIEKYSVVSKEVAEEMALQCKKIFATDYAIATTGNAGPTTDKTDKSVGVVFIAIATPNYVLVKEFNFGQPREKVIERASVKSLEILRKEILKNNSNSL